MAIVVNYWEADGPNGEACIKSIRVKKVSETEWLDMIQFRPVSCVRVTKDRTDNQSPHSKTLWIKPGYKDPFA